MSLHQQVECYIALHRSLGRKYESEERLLFSWADYATACVENTIRVSTMIRWAHQSTSKNWVRRRLATGRRFALWLHAENPVHEVPNLESIGPSQERRRVPHLLSDNQIQMLMDAALQLPPRNSITPHTVHCIIGLIAATGLRRAEACALQLSDVTEDGLVVRETKFGKSRLIPLLDSTAAALHRYLRLRKRIGTGSEHLFVLSTSRGINPDYLTNIFIKLARTTGLRGAKAEAGVTLHDLRHRFAVKSLEQATATGRDDVSRHILALSTYLGHINVSSTYWYLQATPVLLQQIAQTAEAFHFGEVAK